MPEMPTPDAPSPGVPADVTAPLATHARPGQVIATRYELDRLIASGGMAEVWQAHDRILGRPVAVKLLHRHLAADEMFTQRFRAEAVAAARLHHPSIVSIFDTCTDGVHEAIVMELVRGRTLRQYLDERLRLDADEVVQIGVDVADALSAAHRAGVVHRDIKPANILLCDDARVMVTDFGIAKVRDDTDMTTTGTMLGTVKYLAPEQVESAPVDARTDIYALGIVLYEALLGRPPFVAETAAATALARLHQTPRRPREVRPEISAALDDAVMRSLERDPDRRFESASELRAALLAPPRVLPPPVTDDTTVTPQNRDATEWGPPPPRPPTSDRPTAPEPSDQEDAGPPRRLDWLLPTLLVLLIGGSIGLAVALIARTQSDSGGAEGLAPTAPATITSVASFDPIGGDGEHEDELRNAVDGDPSTAWSTENYNTRDFGGIKDGVGLMVQLDRNTTVREVVAESPTAGWSGEVYVADTPASTIGGWGEPVSTIDGADGRAVFDVDGATGRAVLLWFTQLGEPPYRIQIDELAIRT